MAKPITSGPTSFATKIAIGVDAFLALEDKIDPVPPTYSYFDALDRLIKATQDALSEDAAKTLLVNTAHSCMTIPVPVQILQLFFIITGTRVAPS